MREEGKVLRMSQKEESRGFPVSGLDNKVTCLDGGSRHQGKLCKGLTMLSSDLGGIKGNVRDELNEKLCT